jgi:hypothetical protein
MIAKWDKTDTIVGKESGYRLCADVGFDVDGPLFKHQQKKQKL